MDEIFKALADPTRRALLDALYVDDGQSLGSLESKFCMTRFGVAKHLKLLEDAHLVVTRKVGRQKLHFLNAVPLREVHDRWVDKYTGLWADELLKLREGLEGAAMSKVYEIYIRTSPERLWEALTNRELRKKYQFGVEVTSDYQVGSAYAGIGHGQLIFSGTIVEIAPPWRLVQTYAAHWSEEVKKHGHSRVTIEIEQIEDSCRLVLTHDDLPADANPQLYGGWPMVLSGLKSFIETGEILTTPGSLRWLAKEEATS